MSLRVALFFIARQHAYSMH